MGLKKEQEDPYRGEEGIQQADQHEDAMVKEAVTKPVHTAQPVRQEKVVVKSVYTAQPIQQVPGTQQPEDHHKQVVVEDHAASQDQVLLSMGGGHSDNQLPLPTTQPDVCGEGRCITSPRESDNNRQAQSKQRGVTTDPQPEANGAKKAIKEKLDTTATTMAGVGQKIVFLLNILLP